MNVKNTILSATGLIAALVTTGVVASADTTVTVQPGDSVSAIAVKNNTTVAAIAAANKMDNTNLIFVNEQLTIPTTSNTKQVAPAKQAAVQEQVATVKQAPAQNTTATKSTSTGYQGSQSSAKAWIANRESGGNYGARNGQYVGKYQLSSSYLKGDYSAANQERVADNYVTSRYGSWEGAKSHWLANGWY